MENVNRAPDDVEHLLQNARLRSELEPFLDESLLVVDTKQIPTPAENEFLESLLAWESAPVLPISRWFEPELSLQPAGALDDWELHLRLHEVIRQLFQKNIVLQFTDHLSDRELYLLIAREILPSREKKIELPGNRFVWRCLDETAEPELWLKYYATEAERQIWLEFNPSMVLPDPAAPPFQRQLSA